MQKRHLKLTRVAMVAVWLAGCAVNTPESPVEPVENTTRKSAVPKDAHLYEIDTTDSLVLIKAYRGGRLARLGHNHVISLSKLEGAIWLAPNPLDSVLDVNFAVADLVVDDDEQRAAAGDAFASSVSQKDKDGTRRNMLSEGLLNDADFPTIRLKSRALRQTADGFELDTDITIKGIVSAVTLPISLTIDNDLIVAMGEARVTQTSLGLTPFSVMLGALKVEDELLLDYRVSARRLQR